MDDIEGKIAGVKADLKPEGGKKKVATKKVAAKKKVPARKVSTKKVATKKTATKSAADPNVVTLKDLASEAKMDPAKVRRILRASMKDSDRGHERWTFAPGSANLKAARKALGLS